MNWWCTAPLPHSSRTLLPVPDTPTFPTWDGTIVERRLRLEETDERLTQSRVIESSDDPVVRNRAARRMDATRVAAVDDRDGR